ncbi:hypothetical protein BDQ12DRAFT_693092 [Crucibulum laeve]|uniref:Yeast cell wall synthesis Kre9/Knh1-like N-terminal domain-containing protein n=1 Tax=Crucibulum laeve TaxID=68775 RepID=A0A5C3LGT0_9AGAR|nr:hypothetical protein BDQ12DRAFT_693092 [Crucibulum laeve]
MFAAPLVLLALSAQAFATVFTTSPVASSTFSGGQEATITWMDGGSAPTLQDFGPAIVSIYVGNAQQQTRLQTIAPSVDVSQTSTIKFTPDPSIGPNSAEYFIRFESLNLKDANAPQFPALAFSAKFNMNNMSGQFNSSVQAQIAGQSTAPLVGATSAASASAGASSTGTPASTTAKSSSASATASKSGTSASASATQNAALGVKAGWFGVAVSALIGVTMF